MMARDIKGDHVTFGPSGRFLRLFEDGETSTAYGIHEYLYEDRMFADGERYRSMGCIIVKKDIMNILDATFSINEGKFDVVTQYGISDPVVMMPEETIAGK